MAKASLTLPNGTVVQIEGTPLEIRDLLQFYGSGAECGEGVRRELTKKPRKGKIVHGGNTLSQKAGASGEPSAPNLSEIVRLVKDSDEAESIDRNVLDRASQVDRTLLPLYIVHKHLGNTFGLSSGEINKITTDLGVPVSQPNASNTLSGTAAKYVIGDKVRKKGHLVRYKLSRRGLQYIQGVIGGKSNENAS